jgi:hypothetical protein
MLKRSEKTMTYQLQYVRGDAQTLKVLSERLHVDITIDCVLEVAHLHAKCTAHLPS